jgi:hypothetical protein
MPNDWADFGPSGDTEIEAFIDVDRPGVETGVDQHGSEPGASAPAEEALPWSDPATAPPEEALARVENILDQVEQALARLDDGTYGQCQTCGSVIGDDQLDAAPMEQVCASCTAVGA